MSELTKIIGQRVRNYRTEKGLSQEKLLSCPAATLPTLDRLSVAKRTPPLIVSKRSPLLWAYHYLNCLRRSEKAVLIVIR